MASRQNRMLLHNVSSQNNTVSKSLARPLCMLVMILIGCNLITLYFLNNSVQRTSSMDCVNNQDVSSNTQSTDSNTHIPNLLDLNSPYNHLPYLPHNLKDHVNINPNNLNDPQFIESIKEYKQSSSIHYKHEDIIEDHPTVITDDADHHQTFQISHQFVRPSKSQSIRMSDEMHRNHMVTNERLWGLKSHQQMKCDNTIEYLFNNTIHTLHQLKGKNYMESMICPDVAKMGWRHASYVPFIFGNHCEPWWARDAVFIISKLLNKNMFGIEWGAGVSSLWLAMLANFTVVMEHDKLWQNGVKEIAQKLDIRNLLILQERLGRKYCELDYAGSFEGNPGGHEWKKGEIDFFAVDGRLRYASTEWMLEWIKPHGGIVIFDNSDRVEVDNKYGQHNATNLIPKHWLRFDSAYFKQHVRPIQDRRWLKNSMTTIWITRHRECVQGNLDTDWSVFKRSKREHLGDDIVDEPELNFKPF
eukprot:277916_1